MTENKSEKKDKIKTYELELEEAGKIRYTGRQTHRQIDQVCRKAGK